MEKAFEDIVIEELEKVKYDVSVEMIPKNIKENKVYSEIFNILKKYGYESPVVITKILNDTIKIVPFIAKI